MAQQRVSKRTRSAPTRLVAAEEEAPAAKKPRAPKAAPTSLKAKQATTKNPTKAKAKRATKKTTATNSLLSTLATATSSACQRRSGSHAPSRATGACTGARRLASVAAKPAHMSGMRGGYPATHCAAFPEKTKNAGDQEKPSKPGHRNIGRRSCNQIPNIKLRPLAGARPHKSTNCCSTSVRCRRRKLSS